MQKSILDRSGTHSSVLGIQEASMQTPPLGCQLTDSLAAFPNAVDVERVAVRIAGLPVGHGMLLDKLNRPQPQRQQIAQSPVIPEQGNDHDMAARQVRVQVQEHGFTDDATGLAQRQVIGSSQCQRV